MKTFHPSSARLVPGLLLALGLSVFQPLGLSAAPGPVTSTLSAVTVYLDRAVVTRTTSLDNLTVGEHELTFDKLPSALQDDSLQVTAKGTAQATILDVNARNTFVDATPDPKVKDLEDQIKKLAVVRRGYDDRTTNLGQQRDYLLKIETASTTPVNGTQLAPVTRPGVEDWTKLMEFITKNLSDINTQTEQIDADRIKLQDQQTALELQLNQLRSGGQAVANGGGSAIVRPNPSANHSFKTVTVRVAVTTAGSLDLALAYAVHGASWNPSYDARLHSGTDKPAVELSYFGNIRQNTGEDWNHIALTLSTARPSLGGGAPELRAWVLDESHPAAQFGGANTNTGGLALGSAVTIGNNGLLPASNAFMLNNGVMQNFALASNAGIAAPQAALAKAASFAAAAVESGVTSASYKIDGTTTILSDNTPQKVGITNVQLGARLQYQSVPRTMEAAFLSAYVNNTGDFPFITGPMNTFLDDAFIATSNLATVMPGEKFHLALGADEGITVKRKLVNHLTQQTGFFSNTGVRVTYEYLITVTNHKKTGVRFMFKEVLPTSRNDKIKVTLLEPQKLLTLAEVASDGEYPKPGVTNEEDNKLVWREDLAPGEKREFPFKFTVEYPNDFPIEGLE